MKKWLPYPWCRTPIGRKGLCPFCHQDVAGEPIVAALEGENWAHELCALRHYITYLRSDASDVSHHQGTQVQFLDAVRANVVPGVTHEHTRRKYIRFTWMEKK